MTTSAYYPTSGLEELPDRTEFECGNCGNVWQQVYIEGVTDV